ncbi:MAG: molybdopterin-dependent oxidoreductase [Methanomassiliicoccus sp.]|nr:molybdopterin-dependent oxidoreductase [Methanomassiliicoccus sp.]
MALSTRTRYATAVTIVVAVVLIATSIAYQNNSQQVITPNDDFPVVSYNGTPTIDPSTYRLTVNGTVENELTFTLDELKAMPSVSEIETVRSVSGPTGRANWTGVTLLTLLDLAVLEPSAMKVVFHSADGYSSDLTVYEARLSDVLVCYEMNGQPLPADQGSPVRMVVPDHWGYKWAKWVTHIEVVDYDYKGYWESRGWSDSAWIGPQSDWYYHAVLLTVAGTSGALAAVSGMVNGRRRRKNEPYFLHPRLHTYAGYAFAILTLVVFIWWAAETYFYRGSIAYSIHGRLALASVLLETAGLLTGALLVRRWERARWWHWLFTVAGFAIFLLTIVLGIQLAIG